MATYSKLPVEPFNQIAFNAGVIASAFDVTTGELKREDILFATTGGSEFNPNIEMSDLFEDIDNAKPGMKQGMLINSSEPHLTTTALTVGASNVSKFLPNAEVTTTDGVTKIVPKDGIISQDSFFDVWVITDYATMASASGTTSGYFVIHMKNCLNVSGINPTTEKDGKAQFSLDLRAFYSTDDEEDVPYEIYIKGAGAEEPEAGG